MVEIENLSKKYGESSILKGFSHQFGDCGITCILGASGSGKSTLFNLLAGFDNDYKGEILVDGKNLAALSKEELSDYRKHWVGFVFQEYNLLSGYTVLENILLAAELSCIDDDQNKAWALGMLERLGIREKTNEKTENLSGGQKQRVAIARALAGNPKLILADEPTGALDRNAANEIMTLLSELAVERPVFIITHDKKICDFADEVITIEDGKCKVLKEVADKVQSDAIHKTSSGTVSISMLKRAIQNLRVHFKRFLGISLAVTVAVCAMLLSFSSQNIIDDKIRSYEEKNTALTWGQVVTGKDSNAKRLRSLLNQSSQVQYYYVQYNVAESNISLGEKAVSLPAKAFGGIATESMNIGVMPRDGEISITPSLAKQFVEDIRTLIGKEITFVCGEFTKKLMISGIFNGSFDDYYLDASTEQELYQALQTKENPVSIAYKVNGFNQVLEAEKLLLDEGFTPITASKQVESLKTAFEKLQTLFVVVSVFIAAISLFICITLLMKTAQMRAREMGLLMALGYQGNQIKKMLFYESLLTSALSVLTTVLLSLVLIAVPGVLYSPVVITPLQFGLSICGTWLLVWLTTTFSNAKLLKTDPATALDNNI